VDNNQGLSGGDIAYRREALGSAPMGQLKDWHLKLSSWLQFNYGSMA